MTKRRFKIASRMIAKRVVARLFTDLPAPKTKEDLAQREKEVEEITFDWLMQLENHPFRD